MAPASVAKLHVACTSFPGLAGRAVMVTVGGAGGRLVSSVYVSAAGDPVFPA